MPSPGDVHRALQRDRIEAQRLLQAKGMRGTKELLTSAAKELGQRLSAEGMRGRPDSFKSVQAKRMLQQVTLVQKGLGKGLQGLVEGLGAEAAGVGAEQTVKALVDGQKAHGGLPLALREAAMFDRAVVGVNASILQRLGEGGDEGVMGRYGKVSIAAFEKRMQLGMATGKSLDEIADDLTEESPFLQGAPRSWAERISRTEVQGSLVRASVLSIAEADEQLGDMAQILSGVFDDRTGADSYASHGQVRRVGEEFITWFGEMMHPPDRPNDRSVVVPQRISWPIPPELKPRPWSEVLSAWKREGRKGAPPPRPEPMTTIPLEEFGKPQQKPGPLSAQRPAPPAARS